MILICPKCGGRHFHKKGKINGVQKYKCMNIVDGKVCGSRKTPIMINEEEESDFIDIYNENVRLAKRAQKFQDTNRIERKAFREHTRAENAVIEYVKELRDVVESHKIKFNSKIPTIKYKGKSTGIVHLSDLHINELVDIIGNKYDFNVASKRLYLFARKLITAFDSRNISEVYVVFTGDLLNSDRRLDELLSMASNRATAVFVAVNILSQFLMDLSTHFNLNVISVTGNESRIREDYTQLDLMATDNFDFIIYEMMRTYLRSNKNITFISGNTFEYILSINNINILIVHGHRLGKMGYNDISKAITKWSKKNMIINVIMCGHLHETNITDSLLRTGSLVGNNAYSDIGLNLHSKASQNYYIIDEFGNIDATKVDLQNVNDKSTMYNIDDDLDAYNAKSIDKLKDKTNILTIVI